MAGNGACESGHETNTRGQIPRCRPHKSASKAQAVAHVPVVPDLNMVLVLLLGVFSGFLLRIVDGFRTHMPPTTIAFLRSPAPAAADDGAAQGVGDPIGRGRAHI